MTVNGAEGHAGRCGTGLRTACAPLDSAEKRAIDQIKIIAVESIKQKGKGGRRQYYQDRADFQMGTEEYASQS